MGQARTQTYDANLSRAFITYAAATTYVLGGTSLSFDEVRDVPCPLLREDSHRARSSR